VSLVRNLQKQNVDYIFTMIDQDDKEEQRKNGGDRPPDCPLVVVNEISVNKVYLYNKQI